MRRRRWKGTVVSGNLPAAVLVPEPGAFSFNVDASFSVWRADSQSSEGNTDCDINRIDYRRSLPDWFRADVGDIYRHQIRSVRYCGRGLHHIGRCSSLRESFFDGYSLAPNTTHQNMPCSLQNPQTI